MTLVRILAAVVDTAHLTLYKEDGKTIKIKQGDTRLSDALNACKPLINPEISGLPKNSNGSYYVEFELDLFEPVKDNTYQQYEQKTGGFTRFFRAVKSKVNSILATIASDEDTSVPVPPAVYGQVPTPVDKNGLDANGNQSYVSNTDKVSSAINEIMQNAQSVNSPTFDDRDTDDTHTIVAVTETKEGKKSIVPGVQQIKEHIAHAVKTDNPKGMEAFLARLGAVIDKRGHTVEDVLRFMERGDLPLADDGSIIAYKVLTTLGKGGDIFYDCHSKRISQRVGSYVCQDESLIDPSRRTQCSTGLHIARRGYLGFFRGDIIVMVKIRPEDVIAVPINEPDKVRVRGYHILCKVPSNEHQALRSNKAMAGTNALKLLNMAIAGDHITMIEEVRVTAAKGGAVVITPLVEGKVVAPRPTKETTVAAPVPDKAKPNVEVLDAPKVDAKALAQEVHATKVVAPTKAEQARAFFEAGKISELVALRKQTKVSWQKLGFNETEVASILGSTTKAPVAEPKPEPIKEETPVPAPVVKEHKKATKPMQETTATKARKLFEFAVNDRKQWNALWIMKRQAKQSWEKLGFTKKEIERIQTNKPDGV